MKVRVKETAKAFQFDSKKPYPKELIGDSQFHPKAPYYTEVCGGVFENVVDGDWVLTFDEVPLRRKVVPHAAFERLYEVVGG